MKKFSFLKLLLIYILCINFKLLPQLQHIPVNVTYRKAILTRSYVLQIQNASNETLDLWLQAKGKITTFTISSGKTIDFGWAQGYHFDANNLFLIGGSGFDTLKYVMPNVELSPWRITFPSGGGLALSLSQYILQQQIAKGLKIPIKIYSSRIFNLSINQVPQIILKETSNRIFINSVLQVSLFSNNVIVPIEVILSCVPSYDRLTGQLIASQIKVENINLNTLQSQYMNETTQIINQLLPSLFNKYVVFQLKKSWQLKLAKLVGLRTSVDDGRLEIIIF